MLVNYNALLFFFQSRYFYVHFPNKNIHRNLANVHMMQHAIPRGTVVPRVPRDLQRHLVNATAICAATGSDIERCFTSSP